MRLIPPVYHIVGEIIFSSAAHPSFAQFRMHPFTFPVIVYYKQIFQCNYRSWMNCITCCWEQYASLRGLLPLLRRARRLIEFTVQIISVAIIELLQPPSVRVMCPDGLAWPAILVPSRQGAFSRVLFIMSFSCCCCRLSRCTSICAYDHPGNCPPLRVLLPLAITTST